MSNSLRTPVLRCAGVSRAFGGSYGRTVAVDSVDVTFSQGELSVIQGPSGCGKSTLLSLIALIDRPTAGDVFVCSQPTAAADSGYRTQVRREAIAFLYQDAGLISRMTALENILLPMRYKARMERAGEMYKRALDLMSELSIAEFADKNVEILSGGQRQRVGLARAVLDETPILICDEPTASVDKETASLVIQLLISQSAAGRAVICSSHDVNLVSRADNVFQMAYGRISNDQ